ncbi:MULTISPECIES: 3,4-dihydroxy-2-butanone-4-phosphate synthase [Gulbenkiania]|uniref:3,4-dihydroxy-2-butanone 4-phosphate synthase n=1 Tax=Gulbenkiania indica TaxID=375574 RepID=A0A0K6GZ40_9NEIS|nr:MULTISPECIES: 3,4-dihydroxy-2-butanone-4-phosphate synthase [Gulbenkiania]CUA83835.1 3,4-dihydroxy-2-butanone 4-phosphate synthase [Gulbenkiania indica]
MTLSTDLTAQRIEQALSALRRGLPVIVSDDADRENEADLILVAEMLTVPEMARMIRDGSGIVCLCITQEHAERLALPPMAAHNGSRYGTQFTVAIEAAEGVTTGVSAADRVTTIRAAMAVDARPQDLVRPGHVYPIVARPGGLRERRGHTEAAVELARLAGFRPAGVLCELMNPDGTMMRGPQLTAYALQQGLPQLTVAELAAWLEQGRAAAA